MLKANPDKEGSILFFRILIITKQKTITIRIITIIKTITKIITKIIIKIATRITTTVITTRTTMEIALRSQVSQPLLPELQRQLRAAP